MSSFAKLAISGLVFGLFLLQVSHVESLYFHIRETERKCFIEEVPDETLVVG